MGLPVVGWSGSCPAAFGGGGEPFGSCSVGTHAVAVAVDVEDDGAVEEPVEHGAGDVGVVEDFAPLTDTEVGGERDAAFEVSLADDLEERGGRFGREGEVADF